MVLGTWLIGRASFELMFYNYWRVARSLFELLVIIDIFPTKILTLVGMLKMMMMMMVMMTMVMMMIINARTCVSNGNLRKFIGQEALGCFWQIEKILLIDTKILYQIVRRWE